MDDDDDDDPHLYDSSDREGGVGGKKSLFLNFQTCIFHNLMIIVAKLIMVTIIVKLRVT